MPSITATKRLDWLRNQREQEVAEIGNIAERAADADRDLTTEEDGACQRRRERVEQLDRELTVEMELCERQARFEELSARVEPALRARSVPAAGNGVTGPAVEAEGETLFRSPGEYLNTYLRARKDNDPEAVQRIERYRQTLQRAHQTLDQNPGIVPTPILGPVLTNIDARRPAIEAATRRPLPSGGKSFTRPIVTAHTTVGVQATEKTALPSTPLVINEMTVEKATYGGTVNLSWQDRDWTEPAILDLLISDLAAAYGQATDRAFCTALVAAVTQTASATTGATPSASTSESWLGAIYEAAALVFAAGNATPNTLWVAPDRWASLGALTDGSGRPLFPAVSPQNALGNVTPGALTGSVAGFRLAVDANLPAGTAILGDSQAVEFYEQIGGTVSALEPTVLGTAVAYYGYAATAVVRPDALVSITSV